MIGLSLSYCVRDIMNGKVALEDVEKIIAGTKIQNENDLTSVLHSYSKTYWDSNPQLGIEIATSLWKQGKIVQPRLIGLYSSDLSEGHWLK